MTHMIYLTVALLGPTTLAQDPGRPLFPVPGQAQLAQAYFHNNSWRHVRFVVSSANGTTSGVIAAGFYGQFSFVNDGKPRVLCVFDVRSGEIGSVREIEVNPNHVYTALHPPILFQGAPRGAGQPAPRGAATERDKGQPAKPAELKNVVQVK